MIEQFSTTTRVRSTYHDIGPSTYLSVDKQKQVERTRGGILEFFLEF